MLYSWLFAIVAPAAVSYLSNGEKTVLAYNLNEEENQEQGQKQLLEKKFVKENLLDSIFSVVDTKKSILGFESGKHFNYSLEVQSPPPELLS